MKRQPDFTRTGGSPDRNSPRPARVQAEAQDLLNNPVQLMRTVSETFDVSEWIDKNPGKAAKVLARAFLTASSSVTHDWLMELCAAEGFKQGRKRK